MNETLLYRVMSGKISFYIGSSLYHILNVSADIKHESQVIYERTLSSNRFQEWMTDKSVLRLLIRNEICSADIDRNLKAIEESIEDLKISMFRSAFDNKNADKMRTRLNKVRDKYFSMIQNRHSLDYLTINGYAEMVKQQHLILFSLHNNKKERVWQSIEDIQPRLMEAVLSRVNSARIDVSDMRKIARTDPWRSYWNINKTNPFDVSPLDLTDDQRVLIMFSKMYDNAYEHPECPSDDIVNDDDMFDGWMAFNRKKNEKDRTSKQLEDRFSKHKGAGEIFIPVSSREQAEKIDQLNDVQGRMVKKQRAAALKRAGRLEDGKLPDRRIDLQQQSNKQFMNTVKGK